MPLIEGYSEKSVNKNVEEMVKSGHPLKQALAAAYAKAKEVKQKRKGK